MADTIIISEGIMHTLMDKMQLILEFNNYTASYFDNAGQYLWTIGKDGCVVNAIIERNADTHTAKERIREAVRTLHRDISLRIGHVVSCL